MKYILKVLFHDLKVAGQVEIKPQILQQLLFNLRYKNEIKEK